MILLVASDRNPICTGLNKQGHLLAQVTKNLDSGVQIMGGGFSFSLSLGCCSGYVGIILRWRGSISLQR